MSKYSKTTAKNSSIGLLLAGTFVLTACGGSEPGSIAQGNPNFFSFKAEEGVMSGIYNPAGYSAQSVAKHIRYACKDQRVGGYGEAPRDGLVAFSARCPGGLAHNRGSYQVELIDGTIVVEGTVSDGRGNVGYVRPSDPNFKG